MEILRLLPAAPVTRRAFDSHPGLLLEEKVASFVRRMRWKYCGYFQRLRSRAAYPTTPHPSRRAAVPPSPQGEGIAGGRCMISSEAGLAPSGSPAAQKPEEKPARLPSGRRISKPRSFTPTQKRKTSLPERTNRQGRFHRRNGVGKRNYHVAWGENCVSSQRRRDSCAVTKIPACYLTVPII